MRRLFISTATGLLLAPLVGIGLAQGGERVGAVARAPQPSVVKPDEGGDCGSHGTSIEFLDTPREAAAQAKKEQKLVFVLHVSGNFEDPRFT